MTYVGKCLTIYAFCEHVQGQVYNIFPTLHLENSKIFRMNQNSTIAIIGLPKG